MEVQMSCFCPSQPVVALHHSRHRGREVVFEYDLSRAVATSIDLQRDKDEGQKLTSARKTRD